MRFVILWLICPVMAFADPVVDAAKARFAGMPVLRQVDRIAGLCGANTDISVAYCTTQNVVFSAGATPYEIAHVYGHAVQVRHGIADFALAQIRARRDEEEYLRGLVTRQVECLAGVLYAAAGFAPASLTDWYVQEPFTHSHWGRDPLRAGPRVSIGLAARDAWFQRGQAGDVADCAVDELPVAPLVEALR